MLRQQQDPTTLAKTQEGWDQPISQTIYQNHNGFGWISLKEPQGEPISLWCATIKVPQGYSSSKYQDPEAIHLLSTKATRELGGPIFKA